MLDLLQKHTVSIYELDQHTFIKKRMKARELLSAERFDLFAKLFYIKNRELDKAKASKVYVDHILAFNPDGKEPGRSDKESVQDFIQVFDELIDHFKEHEFDNTISLIPVDSNYVHLDGSHRVAALAYYDKEVDVLYFPDVESKSTFDYSYFIKRGLSVKIADTIALETLVYTSNLHLACLWPKMGNLNEKKFALNYLDTQFSVYYSKSMSMPLESLTKFIYESYKHQDWVGDASNNFKGARSKALSCYASNGLVHFVLFQADGLDDVVNTKEAIRNHYQLDKHALHITDDDQETEDLMKLVFTEEAKQFQNTSNQLKDKFKEAITIFKNVHWLNFKVKVAATLNKLKSR